MPTDPLRKQSAALARMPFGGLAERMAREEAIYAVLFDLTELREGEIELHRATRESLGEAIEENERLQRTLKDIAGGMISEANGGPSLEQSPEDFRHQMWTWSQRMAREALREQEEVPDAG